MRTSSFRPVLAAAAVCLPQVASAQLQLLGLWGFDSPVVSGHSIDNHAGIPAHLRLGAAPTDAGGGRTGAGTDRGMNFGTAGQHLYVGDASFLNETGVQNAISVSFWQKINAIRNQTTLFANSVTVERALSAHTPWSTSTLYFDTAGCCDGSQRIEGLPTDPVTWTGEWVHVALIKNGDSKEIYINGVLGPSGFNTAPLPTDFTDLFIGNASNLGEAVDGTLDDFAIYAGALDPTQISQLAAGASPASLVGPNDTDTDGLPDAYERRFFPTDLTKLMGAPADFDTDGLSDVAEFGAGTSPITSDTDGDGLNDGVESGSGTYVGPADTGTNPLNPDSDADALPDGMENNSGTFVSATNPGTNPNLADTDGDGFKDGHEVNFSNANPLNPASRPLRSSLLDLLAYFPFNDATDPAQTLDTVKGFVGVLQGATVFTPDAGGRTGAGTDKAIDFGSFPLSDTGVLVDSGPVISIAATQNQVAVSFWQQLNGIPQSSSFWAESPSVGGRGLNAHVPWENNNFYWDTAGCCDGGAHRISGLSPIDLLDGAWHHFVFQKNGAVKEIWLDGTLVLSGNNTAPLPSDFTLLHIGSDAGTANVTGFIDDFAIYGDALTPAEIALLAGGTAPDSPSLVPPNTDSDGDGMPNAYETANGLNPALDDRLLDLDVDGSTNFDEFLRGTLPNNVDSDGDTLKDGVETKTGTFVSATNTGTDPLDADSDNDGLSDAVENGSGTFVNAANPGTDPNKADTDADTWDDGTEINFGSNPTLAASVLPPLNPATLDLIAWWPFDDTSNPAIATDVIHAINAELVGGAAFTPDAGGRTGSPGDAALDVGTVQGARAARVLNARWLNLASPGDQLAISFWQNLNQVSSSSAFWITSPTSSEGERGFQAHVTWGDNNIYFDSAGCCDGATQRISGPANVDLLGAWHHVVVQKRGSEKEVWIDGLLAISGINDSPLPSDLTRLYIGSAVEGGSTIGLIDDFAIFGDALSEEQILRLNGGEPPTSLLGPPPSLAILSVTYNAATHIIQITWTSTAGASYILEGSTSLANAAWVEINDNIPSGGATTSLSYDVNLFPPGGATPPQLYLRVAEAP